jgi:hypothetical protein
MVQARAAATHGAGRPFFGAIGPGDAVTLANPSRVAQGDRVTHLLYDVERTTEP